jgi:hypothetical protein
MATVKYTIGDVEKTISVTLPAKFQVRLDWNVDKVLAATDVPDGFANDPQDMYRYGTVVTEGNELLSFILLAQYTDVELESDDSKKAYDELISNYNFTYNYDSSSGAISLTMDPIVVKKVDASNTGDTSVHAADPTLEVIAANIKASTSFDDAAKAALINAIEALAAAANAASANSTTSATTSSTASTDNTATADTTSNTTSDTASATTTTST